MVTQIQPQQISDGGPQRLILAIGTTKNLNWIILMIFGQQMVSYIYELFYKLVTQIRRSVLVQSRKTLSFQKEVEESWTLFKKVPLLPVLVASTPANPMAQEMSAWR